MQNNASLKCMDILTVEHVIHNFLINPIPFLKFVFWFCFIFSVHDLLLLMIVPILQVCVLIYFIIYSNIVLCHNFSEICCWIYFVKCASKCKKVLTTCAGWKRQLLYSLFLKIKFFFKKIPTHEAKIVESDYTIPVFFNPEYK